MARVIAILNTIAASAADIVTNGGYLSVNQSGSPITPAMRYSLITKGASLVVSKSETRSVWKVAFSAANDTEYQFSVSQTVDGVVTSKQGKYLSDANGTAAEIGTGLKNYFNNTTDSTFGKSVKATAYHSGSNAFLHVVGNVGDPIIQVTGVKNVTVTADQTSTDAAATTMASSIGSNLYFPNVITSIAGTTTVTVTSTAHGLETGALVDVTILSGGGTLNGAASVSNVRITKTGANTFTLDGVTGSGTFTTFSVAYVGQRSAGLQANVLADIASVPAGTVTGTASAASYSRIDFEFAPEIPATSNGLVSTGRKNSLSLYISDTASNYAAFAIGLNNVLNGAIVNGGVASTTANPELVSLA